MKIRLLLTILLIAATQIQISAQNFSKEDEELIKKAKSGVKFVVLPVLGYNSDLGFQYGGFTEFYFFGKNPSYYPYYKHKFNFMAAHYTKGQTILHGEYDSSYLIPGVRLTAACSYTIEPLYQFYGFNGLMSQYDSQYDRKGNRADYCMKRNMFRFLSSFQGKITENFSWVGGISFWNFVIDDISFGEYSAENTIYHRYVESGLIKTEEKNGGNILELKAGLSYDSRDFEASPQKGISAEVYFNGAPGIGGNSYLNLSAHYRQYLTPWSDRITFAWHFAWQGKLAGQIPFYMLSNIYQLTVKQSYIEGLGGLNTLRGVIGARLLGEGYGWCNIETRFRLLKWSTAGQEFAIGINPFFDAGLITNGYRSEIMPDYDQSLVNAVHCSAGIGIKIGINRNFIASLEYAKAFRSQDGPYSLAFTTNYIF